MIERAFFDRTDVVAIVDEQDVLRRRRCAEHHELRMVGRERAMDALVLCQREAMSRGKLEPMDVLGVDDAHYLEA